VEAKPLSVTSAIAKYSLKTKLYTRWDNALSFKKKTKTKTIFCLRAIRKWKKRRNNKGKIYFLPLSINLQMNFLFQNQVPNTLKAKNQSKKLPGGWKKKKMKN